LPKTEGTSDFVSIFEAVEVAAIAVGANNADKANAAEVAINAVLLRDMATP